MTLSHPQNIECLREMAHRYVQAHSQGGKLLASAQESLADGIKGYRLLAMQQDDVVAVQTYNFLIRLAQVCNREHNRSLQRIARSN